MNNSNLLFWNNEKQYICKNVKCRQRECVTKCELYYERSL